MGLLDKFKKAPGPDALTWEAVARARAVPGVAGAEAVDADTVTVTWADHPGTSTLELAGIREVWAKASGFDRIELMDGVIDGLAPPPAGAAAADPAPPVEQPVPPAPAPASDLAPADPDPVPAWATMRERIAVRVGHPGDAGAVRWPVAGGLEAWAVVDHPSGAAVGDGDLAAWGVDAATVRSAALDALRAADPELDPVGPGQPAWVPTVPAEHPPIWLAAPDRLLAATGLPRAIALAPTPTELVVVDPEAHGLLATILAGTKAIVADADEVLLAAPLLVTPDGLEEWRPDAGHPCVDLVDDLRAR